MEGGGGAKWVEALQVYLRGEALKWVGDSTVRQGLFELNVVPRLDDDQRHATIE